MFLWYDSCELDVHCLPVSFMKTKAAIQKDYI